MKSWKEMTNDAKNKRRAKPSGKIHKKKAKKPKHIRTERRFIGPDNSPHLMFGSDYFSRDWQDNWGKFSKLKDAEASVKALNRKEVNQFEYRVKTHE